MLRLLPPPPLLLEISCYHALLSCQQCWSGVHRFLISRIKPKPSAPSVTPCASCFFSQRNITWKLSLHQSVWSVIMSLLLDRGSCTIQQHVCKACPLKVPRGLSCFGLLTKGRGWIWAASQTPACVHLFRVFFLVWDFTGRQRWNPPGSSGPPSERARFLAPPS